MRRFGIDSNSRGGDETKDLPISIDFRRKIHEVVPPV